MRFNYTSTILIFFVVIISMMPLTLIAATPTKVAVLYPPVKNSVFARVFDEIVDGIKLNDELDITVYSLMGKDDVESIKNKFKQDEIEVVIAIGQKSYPIGKVLAKTYPVVHGGVMIEPNGHSGISLVSDPEQFFSQLKRLAPSVKRVYTVYSESSNGWLIRMAKEIADQYEIDLTALEANSLKDGMFKLRQLLGEVENEHDAVWLLLDRMMPDKAALPIVLEKAWDSHVVVFSNNPSHTRRGALFALFPNHQSMGESLAKLALKQSASGASPLVLPSKNLKVSVNERTASHLGFNISQSQRVEFDLIYPIQ